MKPAVFLFGESEKGEFGNPLICHSLAHLCDKFGFPPKESLGIPYAIQTLLYNRQLLFCRVQEEGFSVEDYMKGFSLLKKEKCPPQLQAIFIPGVGNDTIIETAAEVCSLYKSNLVITEKDLYDYLTMSATI